MAIIEGEVTYYDGQVARAQSGRLALSETGLRLTSDDGRYVETFPLSAFELFPDATRKLGRLNHKTRLGFNITIKSEALFYALNLRRREIGHTPLFAPERQKLYLKWAGGLAAAGLVIFTIVFTAPALLARTIPQETWQNMGADVKAFMMREESLCRDNAQGDAALQAMIARLMPDGEAEGLNISVYRAPIVNAFAMPGGHIVLLSALIERSDNPDKVAAVLAHEIGHARLMHPEEGYIRSQGINLIMQLLTGGSIATELAGTGVLMRFSREAEREADAFARQMLLEASVDPASLSNFFATLLGEHTPRERNSTFDRLGNFLSTHPGLEERIETRLDLPDEVAFTPVLTEAEWQALKGICRTGEEPEEDTEETKESQRKAQP